MSETLLTLMTASIAAALLVGGSPACAEEPTAAAAQRDLNDYLCKDLMRLSGTDRESVLALVHGYRLGKKNTTRFEVDTLAALTDSFIERRLDRPDDEALEAFEKIGS